MLINYIKNIDNSNSHGKSCLLIAIGTWLEKAKKIGSFVRFSKYHMIRYPERRKQP